MNGASSAAAHVISSPAEPVGKTSGDKATNAGMAEAGVIAANRDFYDQVARGYERYESCAFDPYFQRLLEKDLATIQSLVRDLKRTPHCLDCGGGTGNLASKMLARGWDVTVVDVSGETLALLKEKARTAGYSPKVVQSPIESFLERTDEAYDLVAFSSVLHHLYRYTSVVQQAVAVVRPAGIFYSNYDPVVPKRPFWTGVLNTLDIAVAKAKLDPADFLPGVGRRLRKCFAQVDPVFGRPLVSAGDLAEYHVRSGVDDIEILRLLRMNQFTILEHLRYPAGRTRTVRFWNKKFRLLENFKIIAQRVS